MNGLESNQPLSLPDALSFRTRYNAPGQLQLVYRGGAYLATLNRMLARLPRQVVPGPDDSPPGTPFVRFNLGAANDWTIALLHAWATVVDVLGFYHERIVNEGYLRTATERLSVVQLARTIGYELQPGLAASTFLALTVQQGQGEPPRAVFLPTGTAVQSVPQPKSGLHQGIPSSDRPQIFETSHNFTARSQWNVMRPATLGELTWKNRLLFMSSGPDTGGIRLGVNSLRLLGNRTDVKKGDRLLIVGNDPADAGHKLWRMAQVKTVTPNLSKGFTVVSWEDAPGMPTEPLPYPGPYPQPLSVSSITSSQAAPLQAIANPELFVLRQRAKLFNYTTTGVYRYWEPPAVENGTGSGSEPDPATSATQQPGSRAASSNGSDGGRVSSSASEGDTPPATETTTHWWPAGIGLPHEPVQHLLATPSGHLLAVTKKDIHRSMDGGATWQPAGTGLMAKQVTALTAGEDGILYAGTDKGQVFMSQDDGETWRQTAGDPARLPVRGLAKLWPAILRTRSNLPEAVVYSLAAYREGKKDVLAAGTDQGAFLSSDRGHSWQPANLMLPELSRKTGLTKTGVHAVTPVPQGRRTRLYAGTGAGVFPVFKTPTVWPIMLLSLILVVLQRQFLPNHRPIDLLQQGIMGLGGLAKGVLSLLEEVVKAPVNLLGNLLGAQLTFITDAIAKVFKSLQDLMDKIFQQAWKLVELIQNPTKPDFLKALTDTPLYQFVADVVVVFAVVGAIVAAWWLARRYLNNRPDARIKGKLQPGKPGRIASIVAKLPFGKNLAARLSTVHAPVPVGGLVADPRGGLFAATGKGVYHSAGPSTHRRLPILAILAISVAVTVLLLALLLLAPTLSALMPTPTPTSTPTATTTSTPAPTTTATPAPSGKATEPAAGSDTQSTEATPTSSGTSVLAAEQPQTGQKRWSLWEIALGLAVGMVLVFLVLTILYRTLAAGSLPGWQSIGPDIDVATLRLEGQDRLLATSQAGQIYCYDGSSWRQDTSPLAMTGITETALPGNDRFLAGTPPKAKVDAQWSPWQLQDRAVQLEGVQDGIVPGSWLLLESTAAVTASKGGDTTGGGSGGSAGKDAETGTGAGDTASGTSQDRPVPLPRLYQVLETSRLDSQDAIKGGQFTQLIVDRADGLASYDRTTTVALGQSESLELYDDEPVYGDTIPLNSFVPGLEPGHYVVVSGKPMRARLVAPAGTTVTLTSTDRLQTAPILPGESLILMGPPQRNTTSTDTNGAPQGVTPGSGNDLASSEPQAGADGNGNSPGNQDRLTETWHLQNRDGLVGTVELSGEPAGRSVQFVMEPAQENDPEVSEVALIQEVVDGAEQTTLTLTTDLASASGVPRPLTNIFERPTVTLRANVVQATHGSTVTEEVLGSSDGSRGNQRFMLRQGPLTYVSSMAPEGRDTQLEVEVAGVRWHQVPFLYGHPRDERAYTVQHDEHGNAIITFGDGKSGARLPSTREEVRASRYRIGIGEPGNLPAGSLTQLRAAPPGLSSVTNPLPATGGVDPEPNDDAKQNAPLNLRAMHRIVSLSDYEDFVRSFAGIGRAKARLFQIKQGRVLHITVADGDGNPVDPTSALYTNLVKAVERSRVAPTPRIGIASYEPVHFDVTLKLILDPDYAARQARIEDQARQALARAFTFRQREFAQDVTAAEIISLVQPIQGVVALEIERLCVHGAPPTQPPPEVLHALPARLQDGAIAPAQMLLINAEYHDGVTLHSEFAT